MSAGHHDQKDGLVDCVPSLPSTASPTGPTASAVDTPFDGFVIAIGASAGGLEALERLFGALSPCTGAAFVVVQHLSPDHKSMMNDLLARHTAMPVRMAEHKLPLAANTVFLIPPGKTMRLTGHRLQLAPKPEYGLSLPIDIFFNSLAEQFHERAIAVVLSGTGSDGSRGVGAIHAQGGFVFVQEPASAKFDGMPRSAIATGMVDAIAPAHLLADRLVSQLQTKRDETLRHFEAAPPPALVEPLEGILARLTASAGIDFRDYKPATILRRIERRMQVLHAATLEEYRARLDASIDEQTLLRRELLIPVTRFFRDADVWEALARDVIGPLVRAHSRTDPLRVWVACCATGEEAYTLAILFAEAFEQQRKQGAVKIFATDVEPHYVDHAAAGHYPDTIAAEVATPRLERFFLQRDGGYTVRGEIRQAVIFARHNLIGDPPFTRMDLVSCRNALIYFQPEAQERALRRLQYALVPEGHLLLGPSESLSALHADFCAVPGGHKLFRLTRSDRPVASLGSSGGHRLAVRRLGARGATGAGAAQDSLAVLVGHAQRRLLGSYVPPSLLLGPHRELLHVFGDARGLLSLTQGDATLDVLKLLPRELAWAAAALIQAVARDGAEHRAAPLLTGPDAQGERRALVLVARPLLAGTGVQAAAMLLSFETPPAGTPPGVNDSTLAMGIDQHSQVEELESELARTHDTLQATIEELETSNEELQATNEELMSSNEELQSTNEELQSVNEELYTVNTEYQEKVDILNSVNADLENMSRASGIPTVFVDEDLALTRFTPEAALLFKLRSSDTGRSIEDFAHTLDYPDLFSDLRRTLSERVVTEREIRGVNGDWWLARLQPYAHHAQSAQRAVLTFISLTSLKDSQRLQAVVDSRTEHLAVLDTQGTITMVNQAWRRFAQTHGDADLRASGPGTNYLAVCANAAPHDPDAQRAYEGLQAVLDGRRAAFRLQYPCHSGEEKRWFLMHVAPVDLPARGAVVSHLDITPWVTDRDGAGDPIEMEVQDS